METKRTNEAFNRFRTLTQRVVSVPKKKVDALSKRLEKRKARAKTA